MSQNTDLALPYTFLERSLMEDMHYRNYGTTFFSGLSHIIPNLNARELVMYVRGKQGILSLEGIEKFLSRQRQINIREALSMEGGKFANSRNMRIQEL